MGMHIKVESLPRIEHNTLLLWNLKRFNNLFIGHIWTSLRAVVQSFTRKRFQCDKNITNISNVTKIHYMNMKSKSICAAT
jgi:hypothetical protein